MNRVKVMKKIINKILTNLHKWTMHGSTRLYVRTRLYFLICDNCNFQEAVCDSYNSGVQFATTLFIKRTVTTHTRSRSCLYIEYLPLYIPTTFVSVLYIRHPFCFCNCNRFIFKLMRNNLNKFCLAHRTMLN